MKRKKNRQSPHHKFTVQSKYPIWLHNRQRILTAKAAWSLWIVKTFTWCDIATVLDSSESWRWLEIMEIPVSFVLRLHLQYLTAMILKYWGLLVGWSTLTCHSTTIRMVQIDFYHTILWCNKSHHNFFCTCKVLCRYNSACFGQMWWIFS